MQVLIVLVGCRFKLIENGAWERRFPESVAGARIELASGGYEPPEVPLLYPAISI